MKSIVILFILVTAVLCFPLRAQVPDRTRVRPDMHEGVVREGHLQFTHVDRNKRRRLTLDLYRPEEGQGPFPAIVIYFGGGWQNRSDRTRNFVGSDRAPFLHVGLASATVKL